MVLISKFCAKYCQYGSDNLDMLKNVLFGPKMAYQSIFVEYSTGLEISEGTPKF